MKYKLSANTIYWGTVFTSDSINKTLHRKLRELNYHSKAELFPFNLFMKDTRTIDLTDGELYDLQNALSIGSKSTYIDHSDACIKSLKDIKEHTLPAKE